MKRILIIGATSAIAGACARKWAAQGARFFLVARNQEKLAQIAADLRVRGAIDIYTYLVDVTEFDAQPAMLNAAIAALGQIDIALIAYGTLPNQETCMADPALAVREFTNNGTSVISLLTLITTQLESQHCGTLAVISSVAGDRGRPSNYLYGSAKAAVSTFCEGLRARLYKVGVHVIDIRPGFVDTPMTRGLVLPRFLVVKPEAIAQRVVSGIERKVDVLYAPAFWALIMLIIRLVPQAAFKRLKL